MTSKAFDNATDANRQQGGRRNLIINGAMQVAQRGTSAVTTDAAFPVDRWQFSNTDAGDFEIQQDTDAPAGQGFRNSLKWTCNTGSSTTGSQAVRQYLEVQDSTDILDWHTSGGKDVTLSFWIKGSQSGTITTSVREGNSASACFCNLTEVTTSWVKKSITIPAPTIGTWSTVANARAVAVIFAFANHGTANTSNADVWEASNNISLTTQTNWTGITGAEIYLTGVQLEVGTVATPFEHRSYGEELALCQRYYHKAMDTSIDTSLHGPIGCHYLASDARVVFFFPQEMRSVPDLTFSGGLYVYSAGQADLCTSYELYSSSKKFGTIRTSQATATAGDAFFVYSDNTQNAKIEFDAEL